MFRFHPNIALVDSMPVDDQTKVTNEVLKRAENAIFARAINAIRPIEIKKICPERQKLYSNESSTANEHEKLTPPAGHGSDKSTDDLLQVQITVANSDLLDRSVEIKSGTRQQRNKTPIRSIKERLGKKLNEDTKSRSRTPQRKVITDSRNEASANRRSRERRSRDNDRRQRDNRDNRDRKYQSPKSNDNRQSSVTRRNDSQKSSERSYREKERGRIPNDNHDIKETRDSKKSGRHRSEKDSQTDLGRDEHKNQIGKATRDSERDRELHKARVRARIREEERTKSQHGNEPN